MLTGIFQSNVPFIYKEAHVFFKKIIHFDTNFDPAWPQTAPSVKAKRITARIRTLENHRRFTMFWQPVTYDCVAVLLSCWSSCQASFFWDIPLEKASYQAHDGGTIHRRHQSYRAQQILYYSSRGK